MRFLSKIIMLTLFCWPMGLVFAATAPTHTNLLYSDDLLDGGNSGVGYIQNNNGEFRAVGWKATQTTSQLFITLPADLPREGTFVVDVSNFDPANQNHTDKQQIINLYSQANGSKDIFDTDGAWVNIRTGTSYSDGPGLAGYKMLAAYAGGREEDRYMQSATWNINDTYEFKIVWDEGSVWTFVDGVVQGELEMYRTMIEQFRYIFLGTDNMYEGQVGPVYSNIRIYGRGESDPGASTIAFTNITSSAGVAGISPEGYGHGVSFSDVNQDGWYDVFYTNAGGPTMQDVLYINQQNNTFTNEAVSRSIGDEGHTHGVVSADFDNDGDLDVFLSNQPVGETLPPGRNRMYRNDGNGNFTDITDWAGISTETFFSRGAVATDINNDGWLDLFVLNWGDPNALYLNNGNGQMTRVDRGTNGPDGDIEGRQGVTAGDVDNDGDIDLYVCRREVANWLFINDGNGNFTEQAAARSVNIGGRSHGATLVDLDNDADLDLVVMNYTLSGSTDLPNLRIFKNNGNGYFVNATLDYGITVSGYSTVFGDIDNDADLDLYLIRNDEKEEGARPELYLNDGAGNLTYRYVPALEVAAGGARGAGYADIDNDGDIDYFIACTYGDNFMLRNDSENSNHYIDVLCTGPGGDYGGFGTKVAVYQPGYIGNSNYLLGYQESVSNYSYLCQNQTALHFGLSGFTTCDIRVTLTNGDVQDYEGIAADQVYEVGSASNLGTPVISDASVTGGTNLLMTWDAIENATGYHVYRGTSPDFVADQDGGTNRVAASVTDQDGGTSGVQWTDTDNVAGNASVNYYYRVAPVRNSAEGDLSDVYGVFDFELITTETTDFNDIALPVAVDGVTDAQTLLNVIPYCNSIAYWDASIQGYYQYIPGLSSTNFSVYPGYPYYVNVTQDTYFTLDGSLTEPVFMLQTTETTDFNEVMLPLSKGALVTAQDLLNDIPYCNSVAKWDASIQGYYQYIPGLSSTNFDTYLGYPYYINVTGDNAWPSSGALLKQKYTETTRIAASVPHLIYGEIEGVDSVTRFVAKYKDQIISQDSPGSAIDGKAWYAQLGNLQSGWAVGDQVSVTFYNDQDESVATGIVELSFSPADKIKSLQIETKTVDSFNLFQNFPNPFNPETMIQFSLPDAGVVELSVVDVNGRNVRNLVQGVQQSGMHQVIWDGKDNFGKTTASGVYFYTLRYADKIEKRKMLLLR